MSIPPGPPNLTDRERVLLDHATERAVEAVKKAPPPDGWTRTALNYIRENPSTSFKWAAGTLVAGKLAHWGLLGPLVSAVTYPLANSMLGDPIPLSIRSGGVVGGMADAGYESAKEGLSRLKKTCVDHPYKTTGALLTSHQTGIAHLLVEAAAKTATTPFVLKIAGIGLGVDYVKACCEEGTHYPKTMQTKVETVKKIVNPIVEAAKDPQRTLQTIQAKKDEIFAAVNGHPATDAVRNHPEIATAIGAVATIAAGAFGLPLIATGLAVATVIPATMSFRKYIGW